MKGIDEQFIAYLWRTKAFARYPLKTTQNDPIVINKWGMPTNGAGPDIINASVTIGSIDWHGKVEFHVRSSDWDQHRHNDNERFDNVVLHVVWQEDKVIRNRSNQVIPCLELKDITPRHAIANYEALLSSTDTFIPCEYHWPEVDNYHKEAWKERMMLSKLEVSYLRIVDIFERTGKDYQQTFFIYCMRYFGLSTNQDNMQMLAERTPWKVLLKHRDQLFTIEAILFGQANLLHAQDEYAERLYNEYVVMAEKYDLKALPKNHWSFTGTRPHSFPTLRLAHMAALLHEDNDLIERISEIESLAWTKSLKDLQLSSYWKDHYTFGNIAKPKVKKLGDQFLQLLLINAIAPLIFFLGKTKKEEVYIHRALDLLKQVGPEKNKIIKGWKNIESNISSAYDTQALLHLYRNYCTKKRCASCTIGHQILKST